jgi:hypothetical protein
MHTTVVDAVYCAADVRPQSGAAAMGKTKALELLGRRFRLWDADAVPDRRETLTLLRLMMREIDAADRRHSIKVIQDQ